MKNTTREQWILITGMTGAVCSLNAVFCDDDQYTNKELAIVSKGIADNCTSMALEDAILILSDALNLKSENG